MIYAKDREAPVKVRLGWGWKPHRRVHLEFDNTHPPEGRIIRKSSSSTMRSRSVRARPHCQRWDTSAHTPCDPHGSLTSLIRRSTI